MSPTDGTARAVEQVREHMNRVRGRLFQAVEAVGLPLKQENALKGLIRVSSYDAQTEIEKAFSGALQCQEQSTADHTPPSTDGGAG